MSEFQGVADELGPEDSEELILLINRVCDYFEAREVEKDD